MLIDVHAHFLHDRTPRGDWRERNASRLRAGERIGITIHVASILGSWGLTSPTYFPSPADCRFGNDALLALQREHPTRIRGYVAVNPNYTEEALSEIRRCLDAGMIGIKLAASRRADDPLLDPICRLAAERRRADPASRLAAPPQGLCPARRPPTRRELGALAAPPSVGGLHPRAHRRRRRLAPFASRRSAVTRTSRWISREAGWMAGCWRPASTAVGVERLLWGCDLTIETGWAKLRYLEHLLPAEELEMVRWRNAARIFPPGAFPSD